MNSNIVVECTEMSCDYRFKCINVKPARTEISCRLKPGCVDGEFFKVLEWGLKMTGNGPMADMPSFENTFWDAMETKKTFILELFYLDVVKPTPEEPKEEEVALPSMSLNFRSLLPPKKSVKAPRKDAKKQSK